jgi:hypothetical protein
MPERAIIPSPTENPSTEKAKADGIPIILAQCRR